MKRWIAAGLIGVALLIAACGGDDDGGGRLSLEQYFDRMQTIEADADVAQEALPEPESLDEFAALFRQQADIADDSLERTKGLNPPAEVEAAHDAFVASLEDLIGAARELAGEVDDIEDEGLLFDVLAASNFEGIGAAFAAACGALEALADANGISVDLRCGFGDE